MSNQNSFNNLNLNTNNINNTNNNFNENYDLNLISPLKIDLNNIKTNSSNKEYQDQLNSLLNLNSNSKNTNNQNINQLNFNNEIPNNTSYGSLDNYNNNSLYKQMREEGFEDNQQNRQNQENVLPRINLSNITQQQDEFNQNFDHMITPNSRQQYLSLQQQMNPQQQEQFNQTINNSKNTLETFKRLFTQQRAEKSLRDGQNIMKQKIGYETLDNKQNISDEEKERRRLKKEKISFKLQDLDECESVDQEIPAEEDCCNCKKSKCLKLYCECFRKGKQCTSKCNCNDCHNVENKKEERNKAIEHLQNKNPEAFGNKLEIIGLAQNNENNEHLGYKKGCNCKKTFCRKKYCECYNAGVKCTYLCKCEPCLNQKCDHDHKPENSEQLNQNKKYQEEATQKHINNIHLYDDIPNDHYDDQVTQEAHLYNQNIFQDDNQDEKTGTNNINNNSQYSENFKSLTNKYYKQQQQQMRQNQNLNQNKVQNYNQYQIQEPIQQQYNELENSINKRQFLDGGNYNNILIDTKYNNYTNNNNQMLDMQDFGNNLGNFKNNFNIYNNDQQNQLLYDGQIDNYYYNNNFSNNNNSNNNNNNNLIYNNLYYGVPNFNDQDENQKLIEQQINEKRRSNNKLADKYQQKFEIKTEQQRNLY